jgi:hypothetical protein
MSEINCTSKEPCYWQIKVGYKAGNDCYNCERNRNAEEKEKDNFIDVLGKFNELYDYLRGIKLPEGLRPTEKMPKLSAKMAFSVIYILQEVTCCLPDYIEQCKGCLELYDSERGGCHLDDQCQVNGKKLAKKYWGNWCEACIPNIDYYFRSSEPI